jgi:hypothetical protein
MQHDVLAFLRVLAQWHSQSFSSSCMVTSCAGHNVSSLESANSAEHPAHCHVLLQLESPRHPPGVVRSPLQPEEVRGLARSGELSRMLPSEMALLAHGWPRKVMVPAAAASQDAAAAAAAAYTGSGVATASTEDAQLIEEEYYLPGGY